MNSVVYLVERLSIGLYAFCALLFLISLIRLLGARSERVASEYELERDMATRKGSGALTMLLIALELALAIYAITTVVSPTLRADALAASNVTDADTVNTDSNQPFITATPGGSGEQIENLMLTVTAQIGQGGGGPQLILTGVASPTPVGTIIAGYATPTDCLSDDARLLTPGNGQVIFDSLTVQGTASTAGFAFYKFEMSGPSTGFSFAPIGGSTTSPVVQTGVLGQIPLASFQPGDYQFRLTVFDTTAVLRASCTVSVILRPRPPTETPLPTSIPTPLGN